ncbi:CgeB family protein [Actinomyces vulturis]|uniref:CgeB family protein n=1 Tax=Actinomyces vulturis TaxID=1857645 RepID=UPI0008328E23|nr:glycosyltransferase [Actinomyces vulturis]
MKKLLILSPGFHGYWKAYESAFTRRGYNARTVCYDTLATLSDKFHHKLTIELPQKFGQDTREKQAREVSAKVAQHVRDVKPELVLVIRGDLLRDSFWEAVNDVGARPITLVYDEVARMTMSYEELMSHGPVASYSQHDTAEFTKRGARTVHVLDAYDATLPFTSTPSQNVVFIGARYGQRAPLLETLHRSGVNVAAYGREWSHHPFDLARTWFSPRPSIPAFRDIPRDRAYGIQAGALASLNVHENQDGFTMRTYEIPGVGGVQLIDRDDVSDLYDPGTEVLVFHSPEELVELAQRLKKEPAWANSIREAGQKRTLAEHTFDHRIPVLESLWD